MGKKIKESLDDKAFIESCKNGYYELYDGVKIKAQFLCAGDNKFLIKNVLLVG